MINFLSIMQSAQVEAFTSHPCIQVIKQTLQFMLISLEQSIEDYFLYNCTIALLKQVKSTQHLVQ